MKKIVAFTLFLGLIFTIQTATATDPISVESYEEVFKKKETKKGYFKKVKQWFKAAADQVKIKKLANLAFMLGGVSLSGWILISLGLGFTGMLLLMGLMALTADILAIFILIKTGKEKGDHKASRKKAIWGLVLGLLTGLIPLGLLFGLLLIL